MLLLSLLGGLLLVSVGTVTIFRTILTQREKHFFNHAKEMQGTQRKFSLLDIHSYSGLFFSVGLTTTLTAILVAFTWDFESIQDLEAYVMPTVEVEEVIDIPSFVIPPPPPPKVQVQVIEEIKEVETIEVETSLDLQLEDIAEVDITTITQNISSIDNSYREEEETDKPFLVVEQPAEFEGGIEKFYAYVRKELNYPRQARRANVQGKVFLQFVIDKKGKITEVHKIKGIGYGCDEEAIRVLENSPNWKPAKQRGKVVSVRMTIPIAFNLQ